MNDGEDAARRRTVVADYRKKLLQQRELEAKVRTGLSNLQPQAMTKRGKPWFIFFLCIFQFQSQVLCFALIGRLRMVVWVTCGFGFLLFWFVVDGSRLDLGFSAVSDDFWVAYGSGHLLLFARIWIGDFELFLTLILGRIWTPFFFFFMLLVQFRFWVVFGFGFLLIWFFVDVWVVERRELDSGM